MTGQPLQGMQTPPAAAPRAFAPHCPSCGYDLRGLPDSRCPECGQPFTHDALLMAELARARVEPPPAHALLILGLVIGCLPCLWIPRWDLQAFALILMWGLIVGWVITQRKPLAKNEAIRSLWLLVPIIRTTGPLLATPFPLSVSLVSVGAMIAVVAYAYARQPVPTLRLLGRGAIAPMLIIGLGLTISTCIGLASGHYWSVLDYPFWGSLNYPWDPAARAVPYSHVLYAGLAIVTLALITGALALMLLSRHARKPPNSAAED